MSTSIAQLAVIGCGNFARWQHLPNIARLANGQLHSVCDLDQALAQEIANRYQAQACSDVSRIFADPDIDGVVIAVRDHLQATLCQQALQAGKHVYVEKPVGTTPEAIQAVAECAHKSGRQVVVGFQKRCAPAYVQGKRMLLADGGVRNLHLRMCDDAWRWAHGYEPGSLIVHDVCHLFDLARWLCDSPVAMVMACRSRPDDDALLLRMANDCVVTITASGHGTMDMPKERLDAIAERGGIGIEDFCELRSYGYPDQAPVTHFAGASRPGSHALPRYLLEEQGALGLATIRRIAWRLRQEQASGTLRQRPEADEAETLINETIPNFLRDQGWFAAMEDFARRLNGEPGQHDLATLVDAQAAAEVAAAAMRSLHSGQPEFLIAP